MYQAWFYDIENRINIRSITAIIMYCDKSLLKPESFLHCEEKIEQKLKQKLLDMNCKDEIIKAFKDLGKIIRLIYFEFGEELVLLWGQNCF